MIKFLAGVVLLVSAVGGMDTSSHDHHSLYDDLPLQSDRVYASAFMPGEESYSRVTRDDSGKGSGSFGSFGGGGGGFSSSSFPRYNVVRDGRAVQYASNNGGYANHYNEPYYSQSVSTSGGQGGGNREGRAIGPIGFGGIGLGSGGGGGFIGGGGGGSFIGGGGSFLGGGGGGLIGGGGGLGYGRLRAGFYPGFIGGGGGGGAGIGLGGAGIGLGGGGGFIG